MNVTADAMGVVTPTRETSTLARTTPGYIVGQVVGFHSG